uniref:Uncharacterized protein n=1 Tax=Pseudochorda nagaii TaxID=74379 RepID=A0A8F0F885_9PHAE|nr:hypothetical protein [Pseudochorda nagaii]
MIFFFFNKEKGRKALQMLFLVKHLDKIFYELLIDNINSYNNKFIFNACSDLEVPTINTILFLLCSNIFSTEQLTIQLNQKRIGRQTKNNFIYSINKEELFLKILDSELKNELQRAFLFNLMGTEGDKVTLSQALNCMEALESLNLV